MVTPTSRRSFRGIRVLKQAHAQYRLVDPGGELQQGSRDILTVRGRANEHAFPPGWFAAAIFLPGSDHPLQVCRRRG